MKKLIVMGLLLSTMAFAKENGNNNFQGPEQMKGEPMKEMQIDTLTEAQKIELKNLREIHKKSTELLVIELKEKDLAIAKELLADKTDWVKIEAIIKEKANVNAKLELQMLKNRVELKEKFGIKFPGFEREMNDFDKDNKR